MPRRSKSTTTVRRAGNVITFTDIVANPDSNRLETDLPGLISYKVDGTPKSATLTFKDDGTAKAAYARMFAGDDSLPDEAGGVAGVDLFTHSDDKWPDTDADGELAGKLTGVEAGTGSGPKGKKKKG